MYIYYDQYKKVWRKKQRSKNVYQKTYVKTNVRCHRAICEYSAMKILHLIFCDVVRILHDCIYFHLFYVSHQNITNVYLNILSGNK